MTGETEKSRDAIRIKEDGENQDQEQITVFQSACTALAATIGTGNIVGVATALTAGGAGALFWMWVCALLGMATAYAETSLGQKFRFRREDGTWICGPMIYMERGLKAPLLGIFYAGSACLASLGMGSMVQANSIQETLEYGFGVPPILGAGMISICCGLVIFGGAKRRGGSTARRVRLFGTKRVEWFYRREYDVSKRRFDRVREYGRMPCGGCGGSGGAAGRRRIKAVL